MRLSIHAPSAPKSNVSTTTGIDPMEARWAADAVANLSRQLDGDSVVGVILQRCRRELASLATTNRVHDAEVLGPVRVRMAA